MLFKRGIILTSLLLVCAIFAAPSKASLLVTSASTNEVLEYDSTTGAPLGVFASGGGLTLPVGMTFGPDGNLYVTSDNTNQIHRHDGSTGAFIDIFTSGGGLTKPRYLDFGPDGNLYVPQTFEFPGIRNIRRFDGTTGVFTDVFVPAGSNGLVAPRDIRFRPDGLLYVLNFDANTNPFGITGVLRFNAVTGAFVDTFIPLGSGGLVHGSNMVFGPDGNVYISSTGGANPLNGNVLRFDGSTGAFIDEFVSAGSGGLNSARGLGFGPDGNLYVVSSFGNSILRYNGTTGAFLDTFVAPGSGGLSDPQQLLFTEAIPAIPEPATLALTALGLLSLGFVGWRRRRR